MSRLLNVIYSGSSCWAHLKEKIIERRSKMSVKAECYQPTFPPACLFRVVFVISLPVNTEIIKLLLLHSIWRLMCVKSPLTPAYAQTHTQTHTQRKKKPLLGVLMVWLTVYPERLRGLWTGLDYKSNASFCTRIRMTAAATTRPCDPHQISLRFAISCHHSPYNSLS